MGDLGETWGEVTGAAGAAEAAARTYQQMVKTWIMADLGETWRGVTEAAGAAEAAARTYQQAKDDPSRSEEERLQARNEYKQATKRLDEALRTVKVQEHDGLWSEVMDAAQRAQTAGHAFFSLKHDLERPESERTQAKEAYAQAKNRVASLMVELKIMPTPEAAVSEEDAREPESAAIPEEVPEIPAAEQGEREPELTETPAEVSEAAESPEEEPELAVSEESLPETEFVETEEEVSEPTSEEEGPQQEPEGSSPLSGDVGSN